MNKRGLNDVITLVLIIIISLGAIVLIWSFLRPLLQNASESINTEQFSSNYEIVSYFSFSNNNGPGGNGKNITFIVVKKSGEDNLTGYNIILYDSKGKS